MNKHIVVTIVGPDQIGIVERVTERILECHGNVEESRMARLGGDFAILLLVLISAEELENMDSALTEFIRDGFEVFMRETTGDVTASYKGWLPYQIDISGADHEGIINSVTRHLSHMGISIESMDTNTAAAPMSGTLLFTMAAIIMVPPEISYHNWRDPLEKIENEMHVTIDVSPYKG